MSANRNRLTSALRRIVKTDPEVRSLLTAADSKGGKPGAAGVGSSTEAKQAQVCCDGSVGDANPGTGERDPTDGDQTGLNPDDPADLSGLDGGCLTGVTNCATGEAICFCGDDWLPPDGWDSPTDPPPAETYDEGFYYDYQPSGCPPFYALTTCQAAKDFYDSNCNSTAAGFDYISGYGISDISGHRCIATLRDVTDGGILEGVQSAMFKRSCASTFNAVCDEEPPGATEWPADSCVNLAIKGGKIVGSKYDPENDGSYSAPQSEYHLCDGANSMYLAPSATGGWKSIDSTKTSGYLYGKNFELIAHIDGNEYSDPAI